MNETRSSFRTRKELSEALKESNGGKTADSIVVDVEREKSLVELESFEQWSDSRVLHIVV